MRTRSRPGTALLIGVVLLLVASCGTAVEDTVATTTPSRTAGPTEVSTTLPVDVTTTGSPAPSTTGGPGTTAGSTTTTTTVPPEVAAATDAFLALAELEYETEILLEPIPGWRSAVEDFGYDESYTGAEFAAMLEIAAPGRSYTYDEIAGYVERLGPEHAFTASELARIVTTLGPEHAAIPTDTVGGMLSTLGIGDTQSLKSKLIADLKKTIVGGSGLIGGAGKEEPEAPATIERDDLAGVFADAAGSTTITGFDAAALIRSALGIGTEICCAATTWDGVLAMAVPGRSIGFAALEREGADLVGLDTFQQRIFSNMRWGDLCCLGVPEDLGAGVGEAAGIVAVELDAAAGTLAGRVGGLDLTGIESRLEEISAALAAVGGGVGTRQSALTHIDKVDTGLTALLGQIAALKDEAAAILGPYGGSQFPLEAKRKSRVEEGKGWWMKTQVTITADGHLTAKTRTWSTEALRGFTGAVAVAVLDADGAVLGQAGSRKWGVNGTAVPGADSSRKVKWESDLYDFYGNPLGPELVDRIAIIEIDHLHMPTNRWADLLEIINLDLCPDFNVSCKLIDKVSEALGCPELELKNIPQAMILVCLFD